MKLSSVYILSLFLALLVGTLAVWVVSDFSGPLSDGGDTDFYEYVGYFFAHNLTFGPFPQLDLIHNQTFYPYGTNHTLLDWGWERDYWYALCYWLIGKGQPEASTPGASTPGASTPGASTPGPYLQYYYVYSLLVAALGAFWLLRTPFGNRKAFVAGLIVSVFNFYCLWKYPIHLNVAVVHWTTLCIVCTYRILYQLVAFENKAPSLTLWLVWVWLHVQVLSQELGYVAGFALTFTVVCFPVMAWQLIRRRSFPINPAKVWNARRLVPCGVLLMGLILLSLYLYLPLTLQIFLGAQEYADAPVEMKPFWSHPARLLIPYWPDVDGLAIHYERVLRDTFESYGQGSPGLYLVILATVGGWSIRQQPRLWVPVVLMLLLCLVYHPVRVPTLQVFPWFSFNRHGGRASMVYPVLFVLLALLLLMGSEWVWGMRFALLYNPKPFPATIAQYMQVVQDAPGEAVLDFPFCTIGADGVGDKEGLCPYYRQQNAVFTFRRFHHKKVVGQYWGRLLPSQIQPFLNDRWPALLQPGHSFTPTDWQFLDRFLRQHRFSGINLYPDLLTPDQRQAFYAHFGKPIAQTTLPMAGRVEFLPRKQAARRDFSPSVE
jgi:hypothetical protein